MLYDDGDGGKDENDADDGAEVEGFMKEEDSKNYSCHRLEGSEYGCEGRSDSPYGLYSGEAGHHCGP